MKNCDVRDNVLGEVVLLWKFCTFKVQNDEKKKKMLFLYGIFISVVDINFFCVQNDLWPKEIENVLDGVANMHLLPPSF